MLTMDGPKVHISQVGQNKMRISWITDSPTPAKVMYAPSPSGNTVSATGTTSSYRYLVYESGEIHNVVIGPLNPNTVYYYRLGDPPSSQTYNFKTPPFHLPIKSSISNYTLQGYNHVYFALLQSFFIS